MRDRTVIIVASLILIAALWTILSHSLRICETEREKEAQKSSVELQRSLGHVAELQAERDALRAEVTKLRGTLAVPGSRRTSSPPSLASVPVPASTALVPTAAAPQPAAAPGVAAAPAAQGDEVGTSTVQGRVHPFGMRVQALARDVARPDPSRFAVVVFCFNRPEFLRRTLDAIKKYHPGTGLPVYVSQDGAFADVTEVIHSYGAFVHHWKHPPPPANVAQLNSYQAVSVHYGWALSKLFLEPEHFDGVIIVEDDLEIAPDFFDYLLAGYRVLEADPTIWCVSGWNDNGRADFIRDNAALFRSDFFPGLGWLLPRRVWEEIGSRWPPGWWDDWMREPPQRKGRVCIRPEVPRTYTFGDRGVSGGQYFHRYLASISLNKDPVPFLSLDLSYLQKAQYDAALEASLRGAAQVNSPQEVLSQAGHAETVRLLYHDPREFEALATAFGLMADEKAGIFRTAYRGVVTFHHAQSGLVVHLAPADLLA